MSGDYIRGPRGKLSVARVCWQCGNSFLADVVQINYCATYGRYCSKRCSINSRNLSLEDRFFKHIGEKTASGCILWFGRRNKAGYGITNTVSNRISSLAHRLSYQLFNGPIADGLYVCHRCDNPPCINPVHLFLGTMADNQNDKLRKGRQARGERSGQAKLTENDVREIRRLRNETGVTHRELSERFGVATPVITNIINFKLWKHVT